MSNAVGAVIRLEGLVTMRTARTWLMKERDVFTRNPTGPITVDCAGMSEADSAAVALLLHWQRAANGRLVIQHPPAGVSSLAGLYDLDSVLPFPV